MITKAHLQKVIDETDKLKARVQELARWARDTEYGYHFGLADVELDRAVVLMTEALKEEEDA